MSEGKVHTMYLCLDIECNEVFELLGTLDRVRKFIDHVQGLDLIPKPFNLNFAEKRVRVSFHFLSPEHHIPITNDCLNRFFKDYKVVHPS